MNTNPILRGSLSLDGDTPLYTQLSALISRCILSGELAPGGMLPSESELCRAFPVSRSTVRQAIGALEDDGLVSRKQGRGTFVAEPRLHRKNETVYSFSSDVSAMGMTPSSAIIDFEVCEPPAEIIRTLELSGPGVPVYRFTRVRKADGQPIIFESSYYPCFIYPRLTRELLETHSLYSLLYEVGVIPGAALDTYEAVLLSPEEAQFLDSEPGAPAFLARRRTRSESGLIYEFTKSVIRADRVKLDVFLQSDAVTFTRSVER